MEGVWLAWVVARVEVFLWWSLTPVGTGVIDFVRRPRIDVLGAVSLKSNGRQRGVSAFKCVI